jgi:hypothetical protein
VNFGGAGGTNDMELAMGIREALNRRPKVAVIIGVVLCAVAIPMMIWANSSGVPGRASESYYSDDDGKTFFPDDIDKLYPFERNGKQAYRAYVYECKDGKQFVSYLARYTAAAKAKIPELEKNTKDPEALGQANQLRSTAIEVKKPGSDQWFSQLSAQGSEIAAHPTCADGSTAQQVMP